MRLSRGHFPEALRLKIEWEREEKERLAALFNLRPDFPLRGDSWYLPLFFAFYCFFRQKDWPQKIIASGALRHCRGLRCVSIGCAVYKLRLAHQLGKLCFLPSSNYRALKKAGKDVSGCVPLASNLKSCLDIWTAYVS